MKKLLALVLAAVMALSMVACGGDTGETKSTIDKILEQGYITVAISPDFAPSEFKDPVSGEVMGIDVEYAKYVAKYISDKYGVPVELKIEEMDFKSCQAAVATNSVNFSVNGYAKTDERAQNYNCVGPYAVFGTDDDKNRKAREQEMANMYEYGWDEPEETKCDKKALHREKWVNYEYSDEE